MLYGHEGAVVLAEVDVSVDDAFIPQALGKAFCKALGHLPERGVQDGGVFTLDEAHGADLARDGDMDILTHDLAAELCGLELVVVADSGEHAGDGDGLDALGLHIGEEGLGSFGVEGGELLAVVLKAAADDGAADGDLLNILGPVDHGADAGGGRRADAQDADGGEILALYNGVGALRRAEHGLMDLLGVHAGDLEHGTHRAQNAVINVCGGGILDICDHRTVFVDQDGVRVGAAHVNSEFVHR